VLLSVVLAADSPAMLRRLRASNAEIARAEAMVEGPDRPEGTGEVEVRRWLAAVGDAADDLVALYRLRRRADAPWLATIRGIRERRDPLTRGDLAVSGRDLEELGIRGRAVGETLATLLDRVLEDPAKNTRERLLQLAREWR
jgi:tRNA nucleotidyltransferase (CCA-adding enzyme)